MKRIILAIGSFGLVALLGITIAGGIVDAQTSGPAGTSATGTSKKDQFLSTLAGKLGVSTGTLQTAIEQTTGELGFGPGRFAERLRERIHDRIDIHRDRVIERIDLTQAAAFVGLTEDELQTELRNGKTFIEVARDHGKTTEDVRAFLIQQATAHIDERLQAAETAPASDSVTEPVSGSSSISEATEVPAAPVRTPAATA